MSASPPCEIVGDHVECRLAGSSSLAEAVVAVTGAIGFAREKRVRKLLVVASNLTGFDPPSITARYYFIGEWAKTANGLVVLALVVSPEMIDAQKFGVTVARNLGFVTDVFSVEEEAAGWLQNC